MKKLLLFALLCVPAFGQVHSDIATQNTVGNWVKAIPGAFIYVCTPNTADASCLTGLGGTTLFTDSGLTFTVTPPIVADSNGNYTFYATPGIYKQCVKAATSFCQLIEVAGIGTPVGVPFTCPSAVNGSVMAMTSTTNSSCDPNGITDFIGHWTSQSYRATGSFNGTVELTGGLADPTNPPDTNSVALLAPLTVPTPYYLRPPASTGTVGQCLQLLTQDSGTNGIIDALQWATCASSSGSVTSVGLALPSIFTVTNSPVTTTGTLTGAFNNAGADYLPTGTAANTAAWELINGGSSCGDSSHAVSYDTSTHKFGCQAISVSSAPPQASNPSAPTVTVGGTPGAASVCYVVVGNESSNSSFHSAASAQGCTSTANATLASSPLTLSAYADTMYGYNCYDIYRVSGGPSQGKIVTCAGKKYTDTSIAGDGTTAPNTNNTVLDANGLTAPLPGCNKIPKAPYGIDGPPCTPTAPNDEYQQTAGVPADTNNTVWAWVNQNSAACTWTGGMVSCTAPSRGVSGNPSQVNCLFQSAPATPYTVTGLVYAHPDPTVSTSTFHAALAFRESGTGKIVSFGWYGDSGAIDEAIGLKWTAATTFSAAFPAARTQGTASRNGLNVQLVADGTNVKYRYSNDGITYQQALSETKGTFFTTAPDQIGTCIMTSSGVGVADFDYFRVTSP